MRIFLSALGVLWYRRALHEGAERDHTVRARITAVLRAGGKVLVFAEGTTKREGPPGTMYGGNISVELVLLISCFSRVNTLSQHWRSRGIVDWWLD